MSRSITTFTRASLLGFAVLALAACDDPAKSKTKAVTSEAITVASASEKAAGSVATYTFDGSNSKIEWTGSKVTGKHDGGFRTFEGRVSLVDGAPEKSSVNVDIDTGSLFADSDKLVEHLKSADFFEIAKFPKASFASTEVKKGGDKGASHTITGNLTLHGVTKAISFPATVRTSPTTVEVDAEFAINRKDFGIVYAGKTDDLIRDDVVLKLTLRAPKKG